MRQNLTRKIPANLCNFGILPVTFQDPKDYESIEPGDQVVSRKSGGGLRLVTLKSPSGSARDGSSPCWKSQTGSGSTCWLAAP